MENLDQGNNKNVSLNLIAAYGASDTDSDDTETQSRNTNDDVDDSDPAELSEMVLKNNIINACAHGPLSRPVVEETTRHMIIDSAESGVVEYDVTEYRDEDSSDSDSSSDSSESDVDSVKDVEEVSSGDEEGGNKPSKAEPPKVHGELGLDDLPPIEDLAISLPEQDTTKIGTIASIVDRLVIVRALPNSPAVDIDSVLFLESGAKTLGKVFDVFGPVTEPHYCVRFNSLEHVKERGIEPGLDVYIAPRHNAHTNYVFLAELMKIKGSDASWLHDVEPPPQHIDYSDDEEERRANRARKEANRGANKKPEEANRKPDDANVRSEDTDEETPRNPRKQEGRRHQAHQNQRPSESSSRFGSGPSRARNPFSAGYRRNPGSFTRFNRPWGPNFDMRTPPPCPDLMTVPPNFSGPLNFPPPNLNTPPPFNSRSPFNPNRPPMNYNTPPLNPNAPPLFHVNRFRFGGSPRMGPPRGPPHPNVPPMYAFGSNFGNGQPQWPNSPPPPPET